MSKYIAIDIDAQGLFVAAGTARGGHARVEQAFAWSGTEAEGGPPPLSAATARAIGEQLRDRLRAAGIGQAPVLVSVPRDRVILKELRYPAVPPTEEPNIVRFQAMKELTDSPDDVVLDYVPLANGTPTGDRRSMAVAVRKEYHQAIVQVCAAANLRLVAVTPRPYAVASGLAHAFATSATTPPDSKTEAVAALTLGPGGGEFTVTRAGEVVFTRTVPAPVIASDTMLLAEVRRNLTMYAGANPGHPIQALYVAESSGRWALRLGSALGIPVHSYDPLAGSAAAVEDPSRGRFAGAAGLLAAQGAGELPINFATPRQPRAEANPAKKQVLLVAVAAALVLLAGGAWGWFALDAADEDLNTMNEELAQLQKRWQDTEPDGKRLAAVEEWKGRRVVWLDELFDMADRMPDAPGFYASSFVGQAVAPNPKTGKQDFQGTIELKVAAKIPDPVNAVLDGITRDAADPAPKNPKAPNRFYVGADKVRGGPARDDPTAWEYTVTIAKVNSRPADKYTRYPAFSVPSRKNYPPPVAKESGKGKDDKDKDHAESAKDPTDSEAPAPRTKTADAGG